MVKPMAISTSLLISISLLAIFSCGGQKASDSDLSLMSSRVADEFASELKDELYSAIEDSGVVWAVRVCSEKGPAISARYSSIPGWTVRRVSLKNRNPQNAPDPFEKEALEIIESRPANAGLEYYRWTEEDGKESFRFLKGIRVKATCLNCHGSKDRFSDELKAVLDEKYPDDKAYGFSIDDHRGAYSVKIDWPEGKAAFDSMMTGI